MAVFSLKDSKEHYLALSEDPKRFDPGSPVTNIFFDDTNGEVFTVRSGGVTGVTVTGMDDSKCTSFRMEDKGPITSIKFSPDHSILAIQRNADNQNATVEFVNFKDSAPTNVEYSHTCKWKSAKILGFVWPKINEIAYITDHGIELLQVLPEKKQLKSLKSTSFSGAWFSWCARSNIALLAGNNGALLQPFSLNNSTVTKLQKIELESSRPVVERDVFVLRLRGAAWCALFRHAAAAAAGAGAAAPGPTEVCLMPLGNSQPSHALKTGLAGRFAVSVVDELVVVHHQSSQTSQVFDIMESCKAEGGVCSHSPLVAGAPLQPAVVDGQPCPMYSVNWVVFQPSFVIDARLGCLWQLRLEPAALAHQVPRESIARVVAAMLRRRGGRAVVYALLRQLVAAADVYLAVLGAVFDEINAVYRRWADEEVARNTAGGAPGPAAAGEAVVSQADMCAHVLGPHADDKYIVQVVTCYLASLSRLALVVQHAAAELAVRALVRRGDHARLRALVRRGCLSEALPLSCQLLSLGRDRAAAQLALDMMARLRGHEEIVEVLLSWNDPVSAIGAARQAPGSPWHRLAARKLLAAASDHGNPGVFVAVYHALRERNERTRGSPEFVKGEQCEIYVEKYKQLTSESEN